MPFSMSVSTTGSNGAQTVSSTNTYEGSNLINISRSWSSAPTDLLHELAVDVSQIKCMIFKCDVACTLETNSSSSPVDTIALSAGKARKWEVGDPALLTADVTALYITSAAAAGTLEISILTDE